MAFAEAHFAVKEGGKFEVAGEGSRTSGAAMGPWESGRFRVRNEADF